jgi:L-lactate dehydrogenase complex protein LldE
MKVNLFVPCFIDQFYPEVAHATVRILRKVGVDIIYDKRQTCCGQPAFNSGYWRETLKAAEHFLDVFDNGLPVVAPSASCTGFVRRNYHKLSDDKEYLQRVNDLKGRIFELTDFLVNHLGVTDLGAEFNATVTYHDACTALREYGIKQEPRRLLANVRGLRLVEMDLAEQCCGFGGTFSVKFQPISVAMVQQKVESALKTGAEYIVSTEASCFMNIQGYIDKQKLPIKTIHIAQILSNFED